MCTSEYLQKINSQHSNTAYRDKWTRLFGTNPPPLAPQLPFWAADNKKNDPSMSILSTPIVGGWEYVVAKQWATEPPSAIITADHCGGSVDLDSFDPAYQPAASSPKSGLGNPTACKTTADGLKYRLCAHTSQNCPALGQYPLGTLIDIICQTPGDPINGDWSTKYDFPSKLYSSSISNLLFYYSSWGRTKNGYFVSLAYVDQNCASTCLVLQYKSSEMTNRVQSFSRENSSLLIY
jgi:hypothetical protein